MGKRHLIPYSHVHFHHMYVNMQVYDLSCDAHPELALLNLNDEHRLISSYNGLYETFLSVQAHGKIKSVKGSFWI
jgi:hypothetical protein